MFGYRTATTLKKYKISTAILFILVPGFDTQKPGKKVNAI
jgi:hypothetical protein